MEKYYDVFVRDWWRMDRGHKVPNPGAKRRYIARHVTYDDARALCEQYRAAHDPGPLSRKAEFTES